MAIVHEKGDFKRFQNKDLQFHLDNSKGLVNIVLERVIEITRSLMVEQLEFVLKLSGRMAYTQKEHRKVYKALKGVIIQAPAI